MLRNMFALVSVCHPSCGQRPLGFRWLLMYSLYFNILAISGVRAEFLGCTGNFVHRAGGLVSEGSPSISGVLAKSCELGCWRISVPRFPPLSMGAVS